MGRVTFDFSDDAQDLIIEANDWLNERSDQDPIPIRRRMSVWIRNEVMRTLAKKDNEQGNIDRRARTEAISRKLDIA